VLVTIVEDFFCEIDERWSSESGGRPRLHLIGSCALMLQADYERGTKDGDLFQTIDLSRQTSDRLLAIAGKAPSSTSVDGSIWRSSAMASPSSRGRRSGARPGHSKSD
jgi:hypothetical protein